MIFKLTCQIQYFEFYILLEHDLSKYFRYNISTNDYEAWQNVNSSNNRQKGKEYSNLDLSPLVGLANQEEALDRGYGLKNNPEVEMFKDINLKLRLAINTAQFGRTFQDRYIYIYNVHAYTEYCHL